jgi:hypothetical protein
LNHFVILFLLIYITYITYITYIWYLMIYWYNEYHSLFSKSNFPIWWYILSFRFATNQNIFIQSSTHRFLPQFYKILITSISLKNPILSNRILEKPQKISKFSNKYFLIRSFYSCIYSIPICFRFILCSKIHSFDFQIIFYSFDQFTRVFVKFIYTFVLHFTSKFIQPLPYDSIFKTHINRNTLMNQHDEYT